MSEGKDMKIVSKSSNEPHDGIIKDLNIFLARLQNSNNRINKIVQIFCDPIIDNGVKSVTKESTILSPIGSVF